MQITLDSHTMKITRRQLRRLISESIYIPGSKADVYRQTGIDSQRQDNLSMLANTDDEDARLSSTELFNMLRMPGSPEMIDLKINHTVLWRGGEYTFDIPREIYLPILKLYNDPSTRIKEYLEGTNYFDSSYTEMDIADELGDPWDEFESALEKYISYVYDYAKSLKQRFNLEYPPAANLGSGANSDELNRILRYAFNWLE